MRTIEVDFDVYKALTSRRPTEEVTENEVLRDLLGLSPKRQRADSTVATSSDESDSKRLPPQPCLLRRARQTVGLSGNVGCRANRRGRSSRDYGASELATILHW